MTRALRWFPLLLPLLPACGGAPAASLAKPPEYAPKGETKCGVTKSQASPLIVEWPSTERAKLESLAKNGLVAVRYSGCEMSTLAACRVSARYRYTPLTPKHDQMRIRNEDDLYASMPVHAVSFEGKLKEAGELDVKMTIVGRFEAEQSSIDRGSLEGDCAEATHVVTAITAGAFRFFAGADAETGAGASVAGAGVGATSAAKNETLAEDGDDKACSTSSATDAAPPFGCGALLRLEVVPIGDAKPARSAAAPAPKPKSASAEPKRPAAPKEPAAPKKAEAAPTLPAGSRFTVEGDTIVDAKTHLTWQRTPEISGIPWADAGAFCKGMGGGLRLPTKDELLSLGENLPAGIDRDAFPPADDKEKDNVLASTVFYWSSTPHPVSESMAWGVRYGTVGAQAVLQSRSSRHRVRCVK